MRIGVAAAFGGAKTKFPFRAVDFDTLQHKEIQEAGLLGGARVIGGKDPGNRTFGAGFSNRALALEIEIAEDFLAIGGDIVHAEKNRALLHVDIVARGPSQFGVWRSGTIPVTIVLGGVMRAYAQFDN